MQGKEVAKIIVLGVLVLCIAASEAGAVDNFMQNYMNCGKENADSQCRKKNNEEYCKNFSGLPEDVQQIITKDMHCGFMASEISGDEVHDAALYKSIEEMGCAQRDGEILNMVKKYFDDENTSRNILFFVEDYENDSEKCRGQ